MTALSIIAAVGLAAVHLLAGRLSLFEGTPRSVWLSAAGGISVAYVFLHLLPELAAGQTVVERSGEGIFENLEHQVYLVAWAGLTVFYGLERAAKLSGARGPSSTSRDRHEPKVFWIHIASFGAYNALIGYLLVGDIGTRRDLALFFVAMALHFLVTDFGLRVHFSGLYDGAGRWLLSAAVLVGCGLGLSMELPELGTSLLVAFLAGGIILNVLKEELPAERQSRFSAFLIGGGAYAALLLA